MNKRRYLRDDNAKLEELVELLSIISDYIDEDSYYLKRYISGNAKNPNSLLVDIIENIDYDINSLKEIKDKLNKLNQYKNTTL